MPKEAKKSEVTLGTIQRSIDSLAVSVAATQQSVKDLSILSQKSIDRLAAATAKGFAEAYDRLDQIDERVERVETDITGIKQKLTGLGNRLDNFVDHERRITRVETVLKIAG